MVTPRQAAAAVVDPELRVLTIEELGILRDVRVDEGRVTVTITPTYTGCPAMDVIRADVQAAVRSAGYQDVAVETVFAPAWTTDWISDSGRAKLAADRPTPSSSAASAPRRARRCGAAAPAPSPSTT
jgi:ring-1,2-phenylacetyl-CoA epoxidase subunit PaaD